MIQNPAVCFEQPGLQNTAAATTPLGLPRALSGNFASVYEVSNDRETFAVRCFIRQVTNQKTRYAALDKFLSKLDLPFMVPFEYITRGIRVNEDWYPIVKMDWVSGDPLHTYVEQNLNQPAQIELLSINWRELVRTLEEHEIGHGDLQHGNVLVTSAGQLKLVDYDGVFVPPFAGGKSPELGHPNYQHPLRTPEFYDERLDRFTALLIYLNLKAVLAEPRLWKEFHTGDNLLVSAFDLRTPSSSKLWPRLLDSPDDEVQKLTVFLTDFLKVHPLNVPDLETILESSIRGIVIPKAFKFAAAEPVPLAKQAGAAKEKPKPVEAPPAARRPVKFFEIAGWSAIIFAVLALVPTLRLIGGTGALLFAVISLLLPGKRIHYGRGLAVLALCVGLFRMVDDPGLEVAARKTEPMHLPVSITPSASSDKSSPTADPADGADESVVELAGEDLMNPALEPPGDVEPQSISLSLIEPAERPVVRPVMTWTAHRQAVSSMAFTGDGRHLITTSADQVLSIWNLQNQSEVHTVTNLTEPILSITTLTNSGIFATANRTANLQWWSVDGGMPLKQLQLSENSLFPPTVSKDGHLIATAGEDRRSVALYRDGSPTVSDSISGFSSWVKAVHFSDDNRLVAVLSYDDTISIRNARSGTIIQTFSYPDADIQQIECSPDGLRLVALGSTGRMRGWNISTGQLCANATVETGGIATARFSRDGQWIIVATGTGGIHCMYSSNGLIRTPKLSSQTPFTTLAVSPDAEMVATGNNRGEVILWNTVDLVGNSAVQMARP